MGEPRLVGVTVVVAAANDRGRDVRISNVNRAANEVLKHPMLSACVMGPCQELDARTKLMA